MKCFLKMFLLIMAVILVTGCGENNDTIDKIDETETTPAVMESTTTQQENTTEVKETSAERVTSETTTAVIPDEKRGYGSSRIRTYADKDMERLKVDRKLVILAPMLAVMKMGDDVAEKLNELLVTKYGCDFVVEFIGYDTSGDSKGKYTYMEAVADTRRLGQQADIIISGNYYTSFYTEMIKEGLFEDITDMLNGTENGSKLYARLPEATWKSVERDGRIYGCTSTYLLYSSYHLMCNKGMAEKLGLNVEEGFSFYDIGEILSPYGKLPDDMLGLVTWWDTGLPQMLGYYDGTYLGFNNCGVYSRKNKAGEWEAFNPLLDEEFVRFLKTIRQYRENGWFSDANSFSTQEKINAESGNFLFYYGQIVPGGNGYVGDGEAFLYRMGRKTYEVTDGSMWSDYIFPRETCITGIASWSEYKEDALRLLMFMQTEEELASLLMWESDMGTDASMVNQIISAVQQSEPENKEEYYKELIGSFEESPLTRYGMTATEYEEAVGEYANSELKAVYGEYYKGLLQGAYEDVDVAIAETVKLQEAAGINELIDCINRLYREESNE